MSIEALHQHAFFEDVSREAVRILHGVAPLAEGEEEPAFDELQFHITRVGYLQSRGYQDRYRNYACFKTLNL